MLDMTEVVGAGGKFVSLKEEKHGIKGKVVHIEKRDAVYKDKPVTTKAGKTKVDLLFTFQVDSTPLNAEDKVVWVATDPSNPEDDGLRIFGTGGKWRLHEAIAEAVKKATNGGTALDEGCTLAIVNTGTAPDSDPPAYAWVCKYVAPAAAVSVDDLLG